MYYGKPCSVLSVCSTQEIKKESIREEIHLLYKTVESIIPDSTA